jgi:hypothetical protein
MKGAKQKTLNFRNYSLSVLSVSSVVNKILQFFSGSSHSISPTSFSISTRTLA